MARTYLVDLRRQRNESQQDVADSLGISRQYYSMIEDGSRQRDMDTTLICGLAKHFGMSPEQIFKLETDASVS